tara:strand:- start:376 stop:621 length:246 start_codon:yes stop_codon:yes gene_type:complete
MIITAFIYVIGHGASGLHGFEEFRHAASGGHREFFLLLEAEDLITARFKRDGLLAEWQAVKDSFFTKVSWSAEKRNCPKSK